MTPRELAVLARIAEGDQNNEIANVLVISPETVKSHVRNILLKLQARSRAHAVAIGLRQGLIE